MMVARVLWAPLGFMFGEEAFAVSAFLHARHHSGFIFLSQDLFDKVAASAKVPPVAGSDKRPRDRCPYTIQTKKKRCGMSGPPRERGEFKSTRLCPRRLGRQQPFSELGGPRKATKRTTP